MDLWEVLGQYLLLSFVLPGFCYLAVFYLCFPNVLGEVFPGVRGEIHGCGDAGGQKKEASQGFWISMLASFVVYGTIYSKWYGDGGAVKPRPYVCDPKLLAAALVILVIANLIVSSHLYYRVADVVTGNNTLKAISECQARYHLAFESKGPLIWASAMRVP
jgi:hypothetical protein